MPDASIRHTPTAVYSGPPGAFAIAADDSRVYFTNTDTGTVNQLTLATGALQQLATGDVPSGVAVSQSSVFWTNAHGDASVMKVPIGGGDAVVLARGESSAGDILLLDGAPIWRDDNGESTLRLLQGTAPATLGTRWCSAFAVAKAEVFCLADQIIQIPIESGAAKILVAAGLGFYPTSIAVDDDYLYWGNQSGHIERAPRAGGLATTFADMGGGSMTALVGDADAVYWVHNDQVLKAAKADGKIVVVASDQHRPVHIASGRDALYWTNSDGSIMASAK